MPWDRRPDNHLSIAQRIDYLIGGLQWLNDLVLLCFAVVLLFVSGLLLAGDTVAIRPLIGPTVLLPAVLLGTGLTRAIWALRQRTRVSYRRAFLAFVNWLSLSWTVALACIQGLLRREGVFLRTPKDSGHHSFADALRAARAETALCLLLWTTAILLGVLAHPTWLLLALVAWQGLVYAAAPYTSWLAQRTQLSPELERRRQSESARERIVAVLKPAAVGSVLTGAAVAGVLLLVLGLGVTHPGKPTNPFTVPQRAGPAGPWGVVPVSNTPSTTSTTSTTTSTTSTTGNSGSSGSTTSTTTSTTSTTGNSGSGASTTTSSPTGSTSTTSTTPG
jgi:hypothetical protein